jgi:hypothetical protein
MTDRSLGDSELDAAIDRAVRDLMGAEPRADLRERVLSELAGGSSELAGTSARATLWPRFAFGLVAATAVLVIAVQFADRPAERPAEQTIAGRAAPEARPRTDGAPLPPSVPAPIPPRPPARVSGPATTTPPRSASVDDRPIQAASIETAPPLGIAPMTALPRLSSIQPIALSSIDAAGIPAPAIDIAPLTIEQMEIAPLTPRR